MANGTFGNIGQPQQFRQRRDQYSNPLAVPSTYWQNYQQAPNANAGLMQRLNTNLDQMGTPQFGPVQGTGGSTGQWGTVVARPGDPAVQEYMQWGAAPIQRQNAENRRMIGNLSNVRGMDLSGQGGQAQLFQQMAKQNAAAQGGLFGQAMDYNKYLAGQMSSANAQRLSHYQNLISRLGEFGQDENRRADLLGRMRGDEDRFNVQQQINLPQLEAAARQRNIAEQEAQAERDSLYGRQNTARSLAAMYSSPFGSPSYMPNQAAIQQRLGGYV